MIRCLFPHGRKGSLRHVTTDAVAIKDGQILLVKRGEHLHFSPGKLALPGGYVDRDEIVEEAVLRELYEETGYRGKVQLLLWINDDPQRVKTDDNQNISFFYVIEILEREKESDEEVAELKWFELDKVPTKKMAFDHGEAVELYRRYLRQKFPLPKVGRIKK